MDATFTLDQAQIDALAHRLDTVADQLEADEKLTLLTVFALAAEALEARVGPADDDVSGFAFRGGVRVAVGDVNGDLGAGLTNVFLTSRKAGGGQQEYLTVKLQDVLVSSWQTSG